MITRLGLLVLAGCVLSAQEQPLGRGVNFYSTEKEAKLGAVLADEVRQRTAAIDSIAVSVYVEDLGQRLEKQLPAGIAWHFAVIADDVGGSTHEPISLPGGYIFIPASLILAAGDEAEFAGMLAHAMAHVAARHGTRMATRHALVEQASVPLVFMGGWSGMGGQNLAIPLGFLQLQRGFELEADRVSVQMASGAGYDPRGLIRYITRVQPEDGATPKAFSPLPLRATRITALEQAVGDVPTPPQAPSSNEDFLRIREQVRSFLPTEVRRAPLLRRDDLQ